MINVMLKVLLLFVIIIYHTVTIGEAIRCIKCTGDSEKTCNRNETIVECAPLSKCVNISYSYDDNGSIKQVFKRDCLVVTVHWGECKFGCFAPIKHVHSKDCKAKCCDDDLCNTNSTYYTKDTSGTEHVQASWFYLLFISFWCLVFNAFTS